MNPVCFETELPNEAAVLPLVQQLAPLIEPPLVIYLVGDLGAGKTTFARALIQALGFAGKVKSPTYGLLETYPLTHGTAIHLDLYRIQDPAELEFLALADVFGPDSLMLVEWPERGQGHLPNSDLTLKLSQHGQGRLGQFTSSSAAGDALLRSLRGVAPE